MKKEKFWFNMGRAAFDNGLSVEDACPFTAETMMFVQFCAGWHFAKIDVSKGCEERFHQLMRMQGKKYCCDCGVLLSTKGVSDECPTCAGLGFINDDRGRRGVNCPACNGTGEQSALTRKDEA